MVLEQALMFLFLAAFGRWDEMGHWITLWELTGSLGFFSARLSLFQYPWLFGALFFLQIGSYFCALLIEFFQPLDPRVPPFVAKKLDVGKPSHGWLGPRAARIFTENGGLRIFISTFLYLSNITAVVLVIYVVGAENGDGTVFGLNTEGTIMIITLVMLEIMVSPTTVMKLSTIPMLVKQLWGRRRAIGIRSQVRHVVVCLFALRTVPQLILCALIRVLTKARPSMGTLLLAATLIGALLDMASAAL